MSDRKGKVTEKQKLYKDSKTNVSPHNIMVDDYVLLAQKKTKLKLPFDPVPYKVTKVWGHQIQARKGSRSQGTMTRSGT